jgi:formylglycine-generating enzyme required for sulfatase activity
VPPGSVVAPGPAAASTGVHGAVVSRGRYAMLRVAPGALDMGSGPDEPDRRDDETRHAVRITRPFVVGATEVTTRLWREVEGRLPPDATDPGPEAAVTHVAWMEAVHFCNDLSRLEGYAPAYAIAEPAPGDVSARVDWVPDADGYRLLTEAEWEYAARAGGATPWAGSATPDAVAWTRTAGLAAPPMVARRRPNAWGLYDTSGGVWEWVWDRAGAYPPGPLPDPTGPDYGFFRVLRGGSWRLPATEARVAARGWAPPFVSDETTGLRIARTLTGPEP